MNTLIFEYNKICFGNEFNIKVKDVNFTLAKMSINYEYLEKKIRIF